jgi:hypothetical protein
MILATHAIVRAALGPSTCAGALFTYTIVERFAQKHEPMPVSLIAIRETSARWLLLFTCLTPGTL